MSLATIDSNSRKETKNLCVIYTPQSLTPTFDLEDVSQRIRKLEKTIFATQRAFFSSEKKRILHITKTTAEFHIPTDRNSSTSEQKLFYIITTLQNQVLQLQSALHIPQENSTDYLSNLGTIILQNILHNCDKETIRNFSQTSRNLYIQIRNIFREEGEFSPKHIYLKDEALRLINAHVIKFPTEFYKHLSYELQRDEEIQRRYIQTYPDRIFDLPVPTTETYINPEEGTKAIPHQTEQDASYRIQYNSMKKEAFLRSSPQRRQKLLTKEPGVDKILPEFITKISRPEISEIESIFAIPYPDSPEFVRLAQHFPDDPDIVSLSAEAFQQASPQLKENKDVVLRAIRNNKSALQFASLALRANKNFMLQSTKHNGLTLEFASDELRNDRQLALEAIKQDLGSLQFVSKELRDNQEFMLDAEKENVLAFKFASERLKNCRAFNAQIATCAPLSFLFFCDNFTLDKDIVLMAVEQDGMGLQLVRKEMKDDQDIVRAALKQNGLALQFADDKYKDREEIVRIAITQNPSSIKFASTRVQALWRTS